MNTAERVLRKYVAAHKTAGFQMQSDERFQPPREIVNGVESGELDAKVLLMWKDCVERLREKGRFDYGAARVYWENKCLKNGLELPSQYRKGIGGATQGRFKVMPGDQIEDFVRQVLFSKGLIASLERTVDEWQIEIVHLERMIEEAQTSLDKAQAQLKSAKSEKGVAQALDRMEKAKTKLGENKGKLDEARDKIKKLQEAVLKHNETENATIEFEKEFQFLMMLAAKSFDQKTVLGAIGTAIRRFREGTEIPAAGLMHSTETLERQEKYAGVGDWLANIGGWLKGVFEKAWNFVVHAFDNLMGWMTGIDTTTKKFDSLFNDAS